MIMTPRNLPIVNGQKTDFDHLNFDHGTFWPSLWSNISALTIYLTMTFGRRPNGQKIVVILPHPGYTGLRREKTLLNSIFNSLCLRIETK